MLNKFLQKLSLATYRKSLTDNQQKIINELKFLQQQLFLNKPEMIVGKTKMHLPLFYTDHIQNIIYQTRNFYEIITLSYLKKHFGKFDVVVDIGANIGNHALYWCAEMYSTNVKCFEPNEFNRSLLLKNIAINNLNSLITVYPTALGASAGRGHQTNFSYLNTGMNRIERVDDKIGVDEYVEIRTLDSYQFDKVDFVKIDVEGSEMEVIKGASQTILRCRPVLLIEVFENNSKEVASMMSQLGYKHLITLEQYNNIYVPA